MFPHILYGGDYNPEQWSPEVWQEDARLMQAAGVNMVTLGVFSWAKLEPEPGRYDFGWLDQVMDLLYAHGVRVDLATATASPPPWLVRAHPGILPVTVDGVTLWHGSRRHYCPHSQEYRKQARDLVDQLARHFRNHPALALWHIDNEYACHISECFCEASIAAFRGWLQERYSSLEALNEAWGTAFWGQHYGAWEEIYAPRRAPASINPAERLDWQRFCSNSWLECFEEQKSILREITPQVPITTNFISFFKPLDVWKWGAREDVVSINSYPDPGDPEWMIQSGMTCDLTRSLGGGRPWLLMEQATSQVNWRALNAPKRPGQMRLGSYQALARGANGILFFQWRASRSGSEKFHSGMLPHAGTDSRTWREVASLGAELPRLDALLTSQVPSEVAILWDWNSWWALEMGDKPSNELRLLPQIAALYAELFRRNITVDFVHPEGDLKPYRLVLAPLLYMVGERAAKNIEGFVAGGGTLLMTFFSGMVDESDRVQLGGYPAFFRDVLGLRVEEFVAYMASQTNQIETTDRRRFVCSLWSDVIQVAGAEALASYREDYYAGTPALTRHPFGNGLGYYLGTALAADGLTWLFDRLLVDAKVHPGYTATAGVEITCRSDGEHTWVFTLNHSNQKATVHLSQSGIDLITGKAVKSQLVLEPRGVAVIRVEQE
jgi:beta-galactosidase